MSPFRPSPNGPGRSYHLYLPGALAREIERLARESGITELGIIRMLLEDAVQHLSTGVTHPERDSLGGEK